MTKITFLGTGTSQGVPLITCECEVCNSLNKKDNRLRTSVLIEHKGTKIVIDTGPDFRYQMLREKVKSLDAVLFTHGHKDHTAGMDDIRAYNYSMQQDMDVYASEETQEVLKREFQYIFSNIAYPGIPKVKLHTIGNAPFKIKNVDLLPIRVMHHKLEVFGFRVGDISYITDANFIEEAEKLKIKGSKILVLNALRKEAHISHFTFQEALDLAKELNCESTYFTHISHQLGTHEAISKELPDGIYLAYDGLSLEV
jgi:phosphoribosyl 1,2-cyclic phosphate phosphodiesterase